MRGALLSLGLLAIQLAAQSTQGSLTGRVTDSVDGEPLGAQLTLHSLQTGRTSIINTGASGRYTFSLLSPGVYRLEAAASNYQPRAWSEITITVAGIVELDLELRPATDVWEGGLLKSILPQGGRAVLTFIGPDLDTSRLSATRLARPRESGFETASSDVIDARLLSRLPLSGRDAYTMLVLLPQVSADAGTARGLGVSARGQRPSAAGFLLDGMENNNDLVTGPLNILPPEALREYRVSTGNFTAEFGRSSGLLANAVSVSGANTWHGVAYAYGTNEILNARDPSLPRGTDRAPFRIFQPGLSVSGPIVQGRWFGSLSAEYFRSFARGEPQLYLLPGSNYARLLNPNGWGTRLLAQYPAPFPQLPDVIGPVTLTPPSSIQRWLSLARIDHVSRDSRSRQMLRLLHNQSHRPDFIWTPYSDFISPLHQDASGIAVSDIRESGRGWMNETRVSVSADRLGWKRKHPEIPTLASGDGTVLPGSPAFYAFDSRVQRFELVSNFAWFLNQHHFKAGGTVVLRRIFSSLLPGRDGRYTFSGVFEFANAEPEYIEALVNRRNLPEIHLPAADAHYTSRHWAGFAQDTWRINQRLLLNVGTRYEYFGPPVTSGGGEDTFVALGSGSSLPERIAAARLMTVPAGRRVYDADRNNWAVRTGLSARLDARSRTFFRASYGIFYDRPFDNLWQNTALNGLVLHQARAAGPAAPRMSLEPLRQALTRLPGQPLEFPDPILYQPNIRDAYTHSYFGGLRHQWSDAVTFEMNFAGSLGRKLITTDKLNRLDADGPVNSRWNPNLPVLSYRANQGTSSYHGLSLVARRSFGSWQGQASYTWSHAIDVQSEPLAGDFFDLSFTSTTFGESRPGMAAFSRAIDPRGDRGNSDFDQRHNFVMWGIWELPRPLRSWRFASLAAFRSGFPFTVLAPNSNATAVYNRRADVLKANPYAVEAGTFWLDPSAFAEPADGQQGNLGRNALRGPGFLNVDASLSRTFALRGNGERQNVVVRADVFNLFNHANLQPPNVYLASATFGQSQRGRTGRSSFPSLTPFRETGRIIQLMLQVHF